MIRREIIERLSQKYTLELRFQAEYDAIDVFSVSIDEDPVVLVQSQ